MQTNMDNEIEAGPLQFGSSWFCLRAFRFWISGLRALNARHKFAIAGVPSQPNQCLRL